MTLFRQDAIDHQRRRLWGDGGVNPADVLLGDHRANRMARQSVRATPQGQADITEIST